MFIATVIPARVLRRRVACALFARIPALVGVAALAACVSSTGGQTGDEPIGTIADHDVASTDAVSIVDFGPFETAPLSRPIELQFREPIADEPETYLFYTATSASIGQTITLQMAVQPDGSGSTDLDDPTAFLTLTDERSGAQRFGRSGTLSAARQGARTIITLVDIVLSTGTDRSAAGAPGSGVETNPVRGRIEGALETVCFMRGPDSEPAVTTAGGATGRPASSHVADAEWASSFCQQRKPQDVQASAASGETP